MFFIIADDLTGANDSGIQLQKNGLLTFVVLDPTKITDQTYTAYDGIAINTDTRAKPPAEAFEIVEQVTKKIKHHFPKAKFYKKVDSLFRGNAVPEIEGMLSATQLKKAFVAPGYPAGQRIMENGKIENLGEAIDVLALFQAESHKKIGLISLEVVKQGKKAIQTELAREELKQAEIILFDSHNVTDLAAIYGVFAESEEEVILCGSAGMASMLEGNQGQRRRKELTLKDGLTLHVIGSQNAVTETQVSNLLKTNKQLNVGILNTVKIENNQAQAEIQQVFQELQQADLAHPKQEWLLVLDSLFEQRDFELKVTPAREIVARKIIGVLGELSVTINRYRPVTKLVATGGDTALGICQAFNAEGILLREEVLPGIPSGQVVGGAIDGGIIITKSGGFGGPEAFSDIRKYLNEITEGGK